MFKVLTGINYTQSRLGAILHEAWLERVGKSTVPYGNTMYGHGTITNNTITGEVGLIVDITDAYYALPEIHEGRLVDIVSGDGWMDIVPE